MKFTSESIYQLLKAVKDPEIPVISVVDLGIVQNIEVQGQSVTMDLVPTFAGCPAIEVMKKGIEKKCLEAGVADITVNVVLNRAWSTNQMSEDGKKRLKGFGISPPPVLKDELSLDDLAHAQCPVCNSTNTVLKNTFGPTACRAIHFCKDCHETFEQMKPV